MIPSTSLLIAGRRLAALALPPSASALRSHAAAGVKRTTRDGRPTLALRGELDLYTAPALTRAIRRHLDRCPPGEVELDLSAVAFCDCAGLTALLTSREYGTLRGRQLYLGSVSAAAARILDLTNTAALFAQDADPTRRQRANKVKAPARTG